MPKKVGKYELGQTLGKGPFSKVKHAMNTEAGGAYAVRVMLKENVACDGLTEDVLRRDIAVMRLLKHDNIVQLKETLQTQSHIYFVTELVTGGELFDRILKSKKFDEPTARRYFQQLVMGCYYSHGQGIAHGSLKPENLLLDANDNLKITDFGLAHLRAGRDDGEATLMNYVSGAAHCIAPEVIQGGDYDRTVADVWSCGVILYVMLAGHLPFDTDGDNNMHALFSKIELGEFRHARHFSESVKNIINRMLIVNPSQRASLDEIISHEWFQPGFERSELDRAKGHKVTLSAAQIASAVTDVAEQSGHHESQPAGATHAGMDAFEIISHLTAGSANANASGGTSAIVRCGTRLALRLEPPQALVTVSEALQELKGHPLCKEGAPVVKGFLDAKKGLITVTATIVPSQKPDVTVVELRRGRGDTLDFHDMFRKLTSVLGPHVTAMP